MLNFLLEFSVRQRALVLLGAFCLLGGGLYSLMHLPIDAVPASAVGCRRPASTMANAVMAMALVARMV